MMEVDALEVMVTWLRGALPSLGGRVAAKHQYGSGWAHDQVGMSVHLDGGEFDRYTPVQTPRFEVRIYAEEMVDAADVWRALVDACRVCERETVTVSGGTGLVQYALPSSSLTLVWNEVLKLNVGIVFIEAMIAEQKI
jgi:hypothetical protein